MTNRDPWVAMARAYRAGKGIRLTADEVAHMLSLDHALEAAAQSCETECTCDLYRHGEVCLFCEKAGSGKGGDDA